MEFLEEINQCICYLFHRRLELATNTFFGLGDIKMMISCVHTHSLRRSTTMGISPHTAATTLSGWGVYPKVNLCGFVIIVGIWMILITKLN